MAGPIGIGLAFVMGLALFDVARQSAIVVSRARLANDTAPNPDQPWGITAQTLPIIGSPEQQILDALWTARQAAALKPSAHRAALVASAVGEALEARPARPEWGEADLVLAYAASLGDSAADQRLARQALVASYGSAPLLHDAGLWRIGYGVKVWPMLGRSTQDAIMNEGVWMLGVDQSRWARVFDTFRASPAYVPFMLRWRTILSGAPENPPGLSEAQADQRQE
ncbi:hypothetical protein NS355_06985 [Sphingomonas yabuuchiae]|uniref:Uncharacterized protein n=1 Tax=Sphingomonas yabuuchiae TaxID=172044 RepID=A0A147IUP4_9SPHN|nr:hypothetical protein [Sphingomonas yabuuchiae]KTT99340.1 hypothetical protein NS355_06985 [Sphingomonas yabuuchiae]